MRWKQLPGHLLTCKAVELGCTAPGIPPSQHYGMAASYCDKALELDPGSTKALLRRSRCHTARHDYEAAAADLARVRQLDPTSLEAAEQAAALERTRAADKRKEQELFGHMFPQRQAA
jgi:tetratricopeptide (TPR) repeat protein